MDFSEASLNSQHSIMVFRIIKEVLNNTIKHAQTSSVLLKMTLKRKILTLLKRTMGLDLIHSQLIKEQA